MHKISHPLYLKKSLDHLLYHLLGLFRVAITLSKNNYLYFAWQINLAMWLTLHTNNFHLLALIVLTHLSFIYIYCSIKNKEIKLMKYKHNSYVYDFVYPNSKTRGKIFRSNLGLKLTILNDIFIAMNKLYFLYRFFAIMILLIILFFNEFIDINIIESWYFMVHFCALFLSIIFIIVNNFNYIVIYEAINNSNPILLIILSIFMKIIRSNIYLDLEYYQIIIIALILIIILTSYITTCRNKRYIITKSVINVFILMTFWLIINNLLIYEAFPNMWGSLIPFMANGLRFSLLDTKDIIVDGRIKSYIKTDYFSEDTYVKEPWKRLVYRYSWDKKTFEFNKLMLKTDVWYDSLKNVSAEELSVEQLKHNVSNINDQYKEMCIHDFNSYSNNSFEQAKIEIYNKLLHRYTSGRYDEFFIHYNDPSLSNLNRFMYYISVGFLGGSVWTNTTDNVELFIKTNNPIYKETFSYYIDRQFNEFYRNYSEVLIKDCDLSRYIEIFNNTKYESKITYNLPLLDFSSITDVKKELYIDNLFGKFNLLETFVILQYFVNNATNIANLNKLEIISQLNTMYNNILKFCPEDIINLKNYIWDSLENPSLKLFAGYYDHAVGKKCQYSHISANGEFPCKILYNIGLTSTSYLTFKFNPNLFVHKDIEKGIPFDVKFFIKSPGLNQKWLLPDIGKINLTYNKLPKFDLASFFEAQVPKTNVSVINFSKHSYDMSWQKSRDCAWDNWTKDTKVFRSKILLEVEKTWPIYYFRNTHNIHF